MYPLALLAAVVLLMAGCGDDSSIADTGSGDAGGDTGNDGNVDAGPVEPPVVAFELIDPPPAEGPLGVWGFMASRIDESRTIVFGGATFRTDGGGGSVLEESFVYDTSGGSLDVTPLTPASDPGPRYCGCATWDPVREVLVFIGGRDRAGEEYTPETWELDITGPTWTQIAVPATPLGVVGCAMAYAGGSTYLFGGGFSDSGYSDETLRYDPAVPEWVSLPGAGPGGRYDAVMVPLSSEGPLLMYAGSFGPDGAAFFNDIWLFDPATETWAEEVPVGDVGPQRRSPWLPQADENGFIAGFGNRGLGPTDANGDLAYYDFASHTWSDITPAGGPGPRSFTQPLAGGPGAIAYMLGGYDNTVPILEVWRLVAR
jgi:hypothetical protein